MRQFDQYVIRMDGSGRVTLRNRRFLRKYIPAVNTRQVLPHAATPVTLPPAISTRSVVTQSTSAPHPTGLTPGPPILPPTPVPPVATSSDQSSEDPPEGNGKGKIPLALSRLMAHNSAGKNDLSSESLPFDSKRRLRSRTVN